MARLAASAFAQGTVGFANNSSELVRQWTSASDSTLMTVPVGGAHLELLTALNDTAFSSLGALTAGGFSPNYTTLAGFLAANPGWADIGTTGVGPAAGRFNGGNVNLQPAITGGAPAED